MKTLFFLFLITISVLVNAQELKRVTKSNMNFGEVYYVLKSNNSIKEGPYLQYFESMKQNDKAIECFGNYDNNKRTGMWIFCDALSLSNPLVSTGEYRDDKKNGFWLYFYEPESENNDLFSFLDIKKQTQVIMPQKRNEQFIITIDTLLLRKAASGEYTDNKKSGIWNYYYKTGSLACKYDFSSNIMTQNNGLENYDQLGGIERFKVLLYKAVSDKKIADQPFFFENANATYVLTTFHDSIDIKTIQFTGSVSFVKMMEDVLAKMSLDWINFDPRLEENKIQIQLNYSVEDNIGAIKLDSVKPLK